MSGGIESTLDSKANVLIVWTLVMQCPRVLATIKIGLGSIVGVSTRRGTTISRHPQQSPCLSKSSKYIAFWGAYGAWRNFS
ncbi:hypothetical protein SBA3_2940012 [Candidatus Sulfopaludibacter sp. SbA3]|nr:hypothetical protein SBA3_2940012 [Candidatus Sulfopaludibacter sp. SbA3]